MSGHTPGHLKVADDGSLGSIESESGMRIGQTFQTRPIRDASDHEERKANARRLVACWNWCDGQDTEGLELSVELGRTAKHFIDEAYAKEVELIAQRDELLVALEKANASRIAAQTENEALKAERAASGVAERRAVRTALIDERESCARICEQLQAPKSCQGAERSLWDVATLECADAIRSRAAIAKVES